MIKTLEMLCYDQMIINNMKYTETVKHFDNIHLGYFSLGSCLT